MKPHHTHRFRYPFLGFCTCVCVCVLAVEACQTLGYKRRLEEGGGRLRLLCVRTSQVNIDGAGEDNRCDASR